MRRMVRLFIRYHRGIGGRLLALALGLVVAGDCWLVFHLRPRRVGQKRTARVRQMVAQEMHTAVIAERFLQRDWQGQPLSQPRRHGFQEKPERPRIDPQMMEQHPFQLEERLFVERNVIDFIDRNAGGL